MNFNCLIVDDEATARSVLKHYISELDYLTLAGECKNALEALNFMSDNEVDILFLDIEMPKLSGFEFIKTLKTLPHIIITTAYREFALEGFELNVRDYLLKPISFERFILSVNKIIKNFENDSKTKANEYTYFKSGKKNIQVYYDDILFIEGLSNYVKIHTRNSVVVAYERMTDLLDKLPANSFVRVHKSYIVSLNKITAYGSDFIEIKDRVLSIGNTYREEFFAKVSTN
jgi:DNA-binding LytR/AlgR family response regulator